MYYSSELDVNDRIDSLAERLRGEYEGMSEEELQRRAVGASEPYHAGWATAESPHTGRGSAAMESQRTRKRLE